MKKFSQLIPIYFHRIILYPSTVLNLIHCDFYVKNGEYAHIVGQNDAWYAKGWPPLIQHIRYSQITSVVQN